MILIDTSVWIDHFRTGSSALAYLIAEDRVVQHPFVTGELAVGNPNARQRTILLLRSLPRIEPVNEQQFHDFMDNSRLFGTGLGFVDIHLLAAVDAAPGSKIWTRDRRMQEQADRLGLSCDPLQ